MMSLLSFGGASYHMAVISLIAFGLLAVAVMTVLNSTVRAYIRKKRMWLLAGTVILFLAAELLLLQIPDRAYREGALSTIGTPDGQCSVSSPQGEKLRYSLMAPPVVFVGISEIHFWLSDPHSLSGSRLCALPLTPKNTAFAEEALKAFMAAQEDSQDVLVELPSPPSSLPGASAGSSDPSESSGGGNVMIRPPARPPSKTAE